MKLQEFQSKRIFADAGITVPRGEVAWTPGEVRQIAEELGGRVVVKAQVLVGGRGKAGGIELAAGSDEAQQIAGEILGMDLKGLVVNQVLVEEAVSIANELYLGVVIDREAGRVALMASSEGGVDIEDVAGRMPEKIFEVRVDPGLGLLDYQARELAYGIGLNGEPVRDFVAITKKLFGVFVESDASLAEINPLVLTEDGALIAADAKINLDDNALFRHPNLAELRTEQEEAPAEREARQHGLSYVKLDGQIGCMVNGAGLAMATMDITKLYGGAPANFLDIGGGAQAEKVEAALRIILADESVRAVLFNIFGGITRCDEVARGILGALEQVETNVSMVARLVGTNEAEGRALLADAEMATASTLAEAAQRAVELAQS